jgi:hypothetical protein
MTFLTKVVHPPGERTLTSYQRCKANCCPKIELKKILNFTTVSLSLPVLNIILYLRVSRKSYTQMLSDITLYGSW